MEDRSTASFVAELFVDPAAGSDAAPGTRSHPFKTLSGAIAQAVPGTIVYLQPGRYDEQERFPLLIPPGVAIVGDVTTRGDSVTIAGGGDWDSPIFGRQNVALVLAERSQVQGMTVTNPHDRGTGIWIEATKTAIAHCQISHCGREGIFATGQATPIVFNCWIMHNRASGMTLTRYAKGEIERSLFCQNRFGLTLSDFAAPLIYQSEITVNQVGIVLSGASRPVLRENQIVANQGEGLVVFSQAAPHLGDRQSPAGNTFRSNGDLDIRHLGTVPIAAAGNWLHPHSVRGAIEFRALQSVQTGIRSIAESTEASPAAQPQFPDSAALPSEIPVPPDLGHHTSLPFVMEILAKRIMGCFRDGTFQPDRPVTRAQFATIVVRAFQSPESSASGDAIELSSSPVSDQFRDLPPDHWAAGAIAQAAQMKLIQPDEDGIFNPEQPIPRWQAILWLVQGLNLSGGSPDLLRSFRDRVEIPPIASQAVAAAVANGLLCLLQSDAQHSMQQRNRLAPLLPLTRAEIAAWIYRSLQIQAEQAKNSASPTSDQMQSEKDSFRPRADCSAAANASAPIVAIELEIGENAAIDRAGFAIAAQLADRLQQSGTAAKLLQNPQTENESVDRADRLKIVREMNPSLLFQMRLTEIPGTDLQAMGLRTEYAPPGWSESAAVLHESLLKSLDLPDRQIIPLAAQLDAITVPLIRVEFALLSGSFDRNGTNSSLCSYLAEAIQQGLIQSFSVQTESAANQP